MHRITSEEAAELLAVCKELIEYHEKMDASDLTYEYGYPMALATRLYDAVASAEGRIEESYGGEIES